MAGIYVHIPFCKSRCVYCGFYSTTGKTDLQERYAKAVMRELDLRAYYINNVRVHTVYIGGGTPSYMRTDLLTNIINAIKKKQGIEEGDIEEFTIECNPDDVTEEFAKTIVGMGVNRVSLGVQSFSDERLRFLRRRHNAAQAAIAVQTLRRHGIRNISIDLMFGFPDETLSEWQEDIIRAIELDVEHISAYSLMYEEGTPLYRMLAEGKVKECDEALSTKMYDVLMEMNFTFPSSASTNSAHEPNRSSGFLASARLKASLMWGDTSWMDGTGSFNTARRNTPRSSLSNGSCPAKRTYATTPKAYWSAAAPCGCAFHCSGDL